MYYTYTNEYDHNYPNAATAHCAHCKVEILPGCQRREMAQILGLEYDETYFFPGANNPEENTFLNVFLGLKL